jgi:hypothetical protein
VKARVVLLIDACHSGSIGAQLNDGAVADLLQGSGRPLLVFAAAKGRQFGKAAECYCTSLLPGR